MSLLSTTSAAFSPAFQTRPTFRPRSQRHLTSESTNFPATFLARNSNSNFFFFFFSFQTFSNVVVRALRKGLRERERESKRRKRLSWGKCKEGGKTSFQSELRRPPKRIPGSISSLSSSLIFSGLGKNNPKLVKKKFAKIHLWSAEVNNLLSNRVGTFLKKKIRKVSLSLTFCCRQRRRRHKKSSRVHKVSSGVFSSSPPFLLLLLSPMWFNVSDKLTHTHWSSKWPFFPLPLLLLHLPSWQAHKHLY